MSGGRPKKHQRKGTFGSPTSSVAASRAASSTRPKQQQKPKPNELCVICHHGLIEGVQIECGHWIHYVEYEKWTSANEPRKCPKCDKPHTHFCMLCREKFTRGDHTAYKLTCGHYIHKSEFNAWASEDEEKPDPTCTICGRSDAGRCFLCSENVYYGLSKVSCKNKGCDADFHPDELEPVLRGNNAKCPSCGNDHRNFCNICREILRSDVEFVHLPCCGHGFHKAHIDPWLTANRRCPMCDQELGENYCVVQRGGGSARQAKCNACQDLVTEGFDAIEVRCCQNKYHNKCLFDRYVQEDFKCPGCSKYYLTLIPDDQKLFLGNNCPMCGDSHKEGQMWKGRVDCPCGEQWHTKCTKCKTGNMRRQVKGECGCLFCEPCFDQFGPDTECRYCHKIAYSKEAFEFCQSAAQSKTGIFVCAQCDRPINCPDIKHPYVFTEDCCERHFHHGCVKEWNINRLQLSGISMLTADNAECPACFEPLQGHVFHPDRPDPQHAGRVQERQSLPSGYGPCPSYSTMELLSWYERDNPPSSRSQTSQKEPEPYGETRSYTAEELLKAKELWEQWDKSKKTPKSRWGNDPSGSEYEYSSDYTLDKYRNRVLKNNIGNHQKWRLKSSQPQTSQYQGPQTSQPSTSQNQGPQISQPSTSQDQYEGDGSWRDRWYEREYGSKKKDKKPSGLGNFWRKTFGKK